MKEDRIPKADHNKDSSGPSATSIPAIDRMRLRRVSLCLALILLAALILFILRWISDRGSQNSSDWYGCDLSIDYSADDEANFDLFNSDYGTMNLAYLLLEIRDVQAVPGNHGWLYEAELKDRLDLPAGDVDDLNFEIVKPEAREGKIYLYEFRSSIRSHGKSGDFIALESPHGMLLRGQQYLLEASICESVPAYGEMNLANCFKLGFDKQKMESFWNEDHASLDGSAPASLDDSEQPVMGFFEDPLMLINFQVIPVADDIAEISEIVTRRDSIRDWVKPYFITTSTRLSPTEWTQYNFYGFDEYLGFYEDYVDITLEEIASLLAQRFELVVDGTSAQRGDERWFSL